MIEEFMLAANISVAEKILQHYPLCSLLRYTFAMSLLSCYILSRSDQIYITILVVQPNISGFLGNILENVFHILFIIEHTF
jgi:hypothetical protein